jgi:hypothetical protein
VGAAEGIIHEQPLQGGAHHRQEDSRQLYSLPYSAQVLYKVKWVGYPDSQSTWEPVRNLRAVQDMIEAFEKKNEKKLATLNFNHQQKLKTDSKQRPFPNAKAAQPRKLVKNSSEGPGKAVRSDQEKGS